MTPTPIIRHFPQFRFSVIATPRDYSVDYTLVQQTGWEYDGTIVFGDYPDITSDIHATPAFATGGVKWDGCSNWTFHTKDVMHHACGREGLANIGAILTACWDWTAELLPTWDKGLVPQTASAPTETPASLPSSGDD